MRGFSCSARPAARPPPPFPACPPSRPAGGGERAHLPEERSEQPHFAVGAARRRIEFVAQRGRAAERAVERRAVRRRDDRRVRPAARRGLEGRAARVELVRAAADGGGELRGGRRAADDVGPRQGGELLEENGALDSEMQRVTVASRALSSFGAVAL